MALVEGLLCTRHRARNLTGPQDRSGNRRHRKRRQPQAALGDGSFALRGRAVLITGSLLLSGSTGCGIPSSST